MISHNENVKQVFLCVYTQQHNSEYSTHIILQWIQDLKTEVYP